MQITLTRNGTAAFQLEDLPSLHQRKAVLQALYDSVGPDQAGALSIGRPAEDVPLATMIAVADRLSELTGDDFFARAVGETDLLEAEQILADTPASPPAAAEMVDTSFDPEYVLKLTRYHDDRYLCPAPPVCTAHWDDADWVQYIDLCGIWLA